MTQRDDLQLICDDVRGVYVWVRRGDPSQAISPHFDYEADAEQWRRSQQPVSTAAEQNQPTWPMWVLITVFAGISVLAIARAHWAVAVISAVMTVFCELVRRHWQREDQRANLP